MNKIPDQDKAPMPKRATFGGYDADIDKLFQEASAAIFKIEEYLTEHYRVAVGHGARRSLYAVRCQLCGEADSARKLTKTWLDERENLMEALKKSLAGAKAKKVATPDGPGSPSKAEPTHASPIQNKSALSDKAGGKQ